MSTPDYARWFRVGTAGVTKDSKAVTGKDTYWASSGLMPGDMFTTDNGDSFYEIEAITDNTHITLKTAYRGTTDAASGYAIVRNFTATLPAQVAAQTCDLLRDMRRYLDADMQTLTGKSAYEIACAKGYDGTESQWIASLKGYSAYEVAKLNGYSGTEKEWLESLKAAGEWDAFNARLKPLETAPFGPMHSSICRGKNLGEEITSAQWEEVSAGTFTDMYVGDYWLLKIPGFGNRVDTQTIRATIADIDYFWHEAYPWWGEISNPPAGQNATGLTKHNLVLILTGESWWSPGSGLVSEDYGDLLKIGSDYYEDGHFANTSVSMNRTATTEGGYAGSAMYNEVIPIVNEKLKDYFGGHLQPTRSAICNSVKDGKEAGWTIDSNTLACLPNRIQIFGFQPEWCPNVQIRDRQFSLYAHTTFKGPSRFPSGSWLRDAVSATNFAHVYLVSGWEAVYGRSALRTSGDWAYCQLIPYITVV